MTPAVIARVVFFVVLVNGVYHGLNQDAPRWQRTFWWSSVVAAAFNILRYGEVMTQP